ncbi:type II toxin-antitoxin system VapC family toxin [Paenarthrobacter nitroguajacolicus]|uniref:Type II toxin-antitoxin system VapC family toxin n=1 Tax=Paenarthrobacter nitroguajacolicus TaxID=211146 RepID=A0A558HCE2_PAENT|nr:type II toxin-antitoxin system VapC family toxin [Paenarthrobacter nitroguajacolicus]TVU66799.1 type II toxin-antitoxin system VapC family toxin [Paenarthrobacter nitroguajacolicus]
MIVYADTSAILKLVVEEHESDALAAHLQEVRVAGGHLVASMLLYTELHCAARRRSLPFDQVNDVLSGLNLVDVTRSDLMYASALPRQLRSADAIHLATAIRLQVDAVVAYDQELLLAAKESGLMTASPGPSGT